MDMFRYRCYPLKPCNAFQDTNAEQMLQRESCIYSEPESSSHVREMQENSLYDTAESGKALNVMLTTEI